MAEITTLPELTDEVLKPLVGGFARIIDPAKQEIYQGKVVSFVFSTPYKSTLLVRFELMGRMSGHGYWGQCAAVPLEIILNVYATKLLLGKVLFLYAPLYGKSVTFYPPEECYFDLIRILRG